MKDDKKANTDEKKPKLGEKLFYKTKNIWDDEKLHSQIMKYAAPYKKFLGDVKTEREATAWAVGRLKKAGFKEGKGEKVFMVNRGKSVIAAWMGKQPITEGFNIIVAHTDAPRIDLKQVPVYEDTGHAMLDTHYYGGIKKYQWLKKLEVIIGEEDEGAVVITDILIHLAAQQMENPASKVMTGDQLNALAGTMPLTGEDYKDESDKIRLNVMKILNDKYGIKEEDFISAELELVPSGKALEVGIDKSMIMGYGQDDRVCAFTSLEALIDMKEQPERTSIVWLVDKEEIGSEGSTGAITKFLEYFIETIAPNKPINSIMQNSFCMSADVNAGFDVNFKDRFESKNASFIGKGITITKFTGRGGKGGANDASAEFLGALRKLFADKSVPYQTAELGAVDIGGGGTVAMYMAARGIDTVDAGPAVLGMHAPLETTSKADVWSSYIAYKAFLEHFAGKYVKIAKTF
jgi:aspartyl aminopeptidase